MPEVEIFICHSNPLINQIQGYEAKAIALKALLEAEFGSSLIVTIFAGRNLSFEILFDSALIFSKLATGGFPVLEDVCRHVSDISFKVRSGESV